MQENHLSDLQLRVEVERIRQHLESTNKSLSTTLYPAAILWLYFWWTTRSPSCLYWAVLMHTWQLWRIYLGTHHRRRYADCTDLLTLRRAEWWSASRGVMFAVLWGISPWFLLGGGDSVQLSVALLMLLGIMSGSLGGLTYSLRAGQWFLVALGVSLAVWMLSRADLPHALLAVSTCVYTSSLVVLFRRQHHILVQQLSQRFQAKEQALVLERQKAELEVLHKERNHLFAAASHDLRQPVQALALQAQTLSLALQEHPQAVAAQRMVGIAQAMGETLDSVLFLHQMEHLSQAAKDVRFGAEDLLFEAAQLWQGIAMRKSLDLRFHGLDLVAFAPRLLVFRLLNNLIDNAIKYTESGGVLVAVRARMRQGKPWVRLEVWDTGGGIAPADRDKIFEPFYRATTAAAHSAAAGLGLGLSAAREACAKRGWPMGLRSTGARGSVFYLEVPAVAASAPNVST